MRVLVVGATGALEPAARDLVGRGEQVYGLARGARRVADTGVRPVSVDFQDVAALIAALTSLPLFHAALVYAPAAPPAARRAIGDRVDGRVVELVTSAAAAPPADADPAHVPSLGVTVLLGWTDDPPRWHSPAELSRAALDALDDGQPRTLGTVRPWPDRP